MYVDGDRLQVVYLWGVFAPLSSAVDSHRYVQMVYGCIEYFIFCTSCATRSLDALNRTYGDDRDGLTVLTNKIGTKVVSIVCWH